MKPLNDLVRLIAEAKLDQAFEALRSSDLLPHFDEDIRRQVILNSAKYERLKLHENKGVITLEESDVWNNRIIMALLNLLSDPETVKSFEDQPKQPTSGLRDYRSENVYLRSKEDFGDFKALAQDATEIFIFAANARNLFNDNLKFFSQKLGPDFKLRVLLYDKKSAAFKAWKEISFYQKQEDRIDWTIERLEEFSKNEKNIQLELRYWNAILTYNAVYLELPNNEEKLVIQFYTYDFTVEDKPHILLSKKENPAWFKLFKDQIEIAWTTAEEHRHTFGEQGR